MRHTSTSAFNNAIAVIQPKLKTDSDSMKYHRLPPHKRNINLPNYNIENELASIDKNVAAKFAEVPQSYLKWDEDFVETGEKKYNLKTGKMETPVYRKVDYTTPMVPELPSPDPRDCHLSPTPETKQWVKFLLDKKEAMRRQKYVWLDGSETRAILKHVFRAREDDLDAFEHASDNMNHDPYLAFKKRNMYRLAMDLEQGTARRLTRVPYVLSEDDGLVNETSNMHRFFGETQDWVMHNTAFQGLTALKAFLIYGTMDLISPRPGNDPTRNYNCTGNFHRIITTPNIIGTSTPEGVHQDGAEYTMTTFLKSHNVDFDGGSAVVSLLNLNSQLGVDWDQFDPKTVIAETQHRNFLDTLIFADSEMNHVATPMRLLDESKPAHRDIVVVTSRRMAIKGGSYPTAPFEEHEISHQTLPCTFGIKSKYLAKHYGCDKACTNCSCLEGKCKE